MTDASGPELIVTTQHMRTVPGFGPRPGFCLPRCRQFARDHGLDWRRFVREGLPASELLATGNALAIALVEHARSVEEGAARG